MSGLPGDANLWDSWIPRVAFWWMFIILEGEVFLAGVGLRKFRPMPASYDHWARRHLCLATPTVSRDLGFSALSKESPLMASKDPMRTNSNHGHSRVALKIKIPIANKSLANTIKQRYNEQFTWLSFYDGIRHDAVRLCCLQQFTNIDWNPNIGVLAGRLQFQKRFRNPRNLSIHQTTLNSQFAYSI